MVSIRAPRTGRKLATIDHLNLALCVSIRAPRTGRKQHVKNRSWLHFSFNPRPANGAKGTLRSRVLYENTCFNPRPANGAKGSSSSVSVQFIKGFNPRPANGAKAPVASNIAKLRKFQSAPRERGERIGGLAIAPRLAVSIRAPRTGRKNRNCC